MKNAGYVCRDFLIPILTARRTWFIIQLSDNVNTDEKRETYAEDVRTMLQMFRDGCPRARILWVAAWYGWTLNYGPIETACNELGVDLVDIRDLSEDAATKCRGEHLYKDDGIVVEITFIRCLPPIPEIPA